ncbi:colicin D domain-containing protein [Mycobacterium sp. pW049]|uniref:colicin D domain-containing protein n=1 Tax=[Mycobacterium] bulgaricum TaxID=3238985 RepID=UPI00351B5BE6
MTEQDVDPDTFYAVGKGLYEKAGKLYDAFSVNVTLLGETGSMAGTDEAGTAWAASYDLRAAEILCAVNDLTKAMENYGGVVIQAGHNHAIAEHNATPGNRGPAPAIPPEPASTAGVLSTPPSAGGPGSGLLDNVGLMAQVGVPVPDGDTDKVSKAGDAWDRLATVYQTTTVAEGLGVDARAFSDTKSPEVEYIVRDLEELQSATSSVLDACAELAQSCRDYRSALDDLRTQLEGILEDLAVELAITAAVGVAASFVSFGAGAVAATAKAAHSVTRFARIIADAVAAWKISKNISTGVKRAQDIVGVRTKLQRIKNLGRKNKPEEKPPVGPGVKLVDETPLTTPRSQVEKKFHHAKDFGVTESRGKAGFESFERAVRSHVDDPATVHINGTYRGDSAIINYNPNSGLAVIQKPSGEFVSGWRLAPEQINNLLQRGSLR